MILFTNPLPADWNLPTVRIVPCGPDEDQDVTVEQLIAQGTHNCGGFRDTKLTEQTYLPPAYAVRGKVMFIFGSVRLYRGGGVPTLAWIGGGVLTLAWWGVPTF